jgi:hypothetical protein
LPTPIHQPNRRQPPPTKHPPPGDKPLKDADVAPLLQPGSFPALTDLTLAGVLNFTRAGYAAVCA